MTGFWKMDGRMLIRLAEHAQSKGDGEVLDLVLEAFEKRFAQEAARTGRTPTQVRKRLRKVRRMRNGVELVSVDHGAIPRREADRLAAVTTQSVAASETKRTQKVSTGIETRLANCGTLCLCCGENRPIAGDWICFQCA